MSLRKPTPDFEEQLLRPLRLQPLGEHVDHLLQDRLVGGGKQSPALGRQIVENIRPP